MRKSTKIVMFGLLVIAGMIGGSNIGNANNSAAKMVPAATSTLKTSASTSVAIMLCIDLSGSMWDTLPGSNETKFNGTQDASHLLVNLIDPSVSIGLSGFAEEAVVMQPLAPKTSSQEAAMNVAIENMSNWNIGAITDTYLGLITAVNALASYSATSKYLILMTDGLADDAPASYMQFEQGSNYVYSGDGLGKTYLWHWANDSASPAVIAHNDGICIDTVGFGNDSGTSPDVDPVFLNTIANTTVCGSYYNAANVDSLAMSFATLGNTLSGWRNSHTWYGTATKNSNVLVGTYSIDANYPIVRIYVEWNATGWTISIVVKNGNTVLSDIDQSASGAKPAWVVVNAKGYSSIDIYIYADPAQGSTISYGTNAASNSSYGSPGTSTPGYPIGIVAGLLAITVVSLLVRKRQKFGH